MKKLCSCGKPIMIIDSLLKSDVGTNVITQSIDFGCLNKQCAKYQIVVEHVDQDITQ